MARAKRHFIATFNEQKTDNKFNLERKRDVKIRTLLCGINQRAIMHSIGKCVRKHTLFIPLVFFSAFVKFSPCLNGDAVQHRASRRLSSDTKFKCTAGKCECERMRASEIMFNLSGSVCVVRRLAYAIQSLWFELLQQRR